MENWRRTSRVACDRIASDIVAECRKTPFLANAIKTKTGEGGRMRTNPEYNSAHHDNGEVCPVAMHVFVSKRGTELEPERTVVRRCDHASYARWTKTVRQLLDNVFLPPW